MSDPIKITANGLFNNQDKDDSSEEQYDIEHRDTVKDLKLQHLESDIRTSKKSKTKDEKSLDS